MRFCSSSILVLPFLSLSLSLSLLAVLISFPRRNQPSAKNAIHDRQMTSQERFSAGVRVNLTFHVESIVGTHARTHVRAQSYCHCMVLLPFGFLWLSLVAMEIEALFGVSRSLLSLFLTMRGTQKSDVGFPQGQSALLIF